MRSENRAASELSGFAAAPDKKMPLAGATQAAPSPPRQESGDSPCPGTELASACGRQVDEFAIGNPRKRNDLWPGDVAPRRPEWSSKSVRPERGGPGCGISFVVRF